jgi:bifunctional non-homologous end joining protein LigD
MSEQRVRIDDRTFSVSNLEKELFDDGITKAELIEHYVRFGDAMLRSIGGRALSLKRYPDGIHGEAWFQKRPSSHFPDWITRARLGSDGEEYVVADQRATLAYLANQGTIELHTMMTRAEAPAHPVELVFDLDPSADAPVSAVRDATRWCGQLLEELGAETRLKTTGSSGFHVHVRLDGDVEQEETRRFARDAAQVLASRHPQQLTVHVRKARRRGRVFVDWLRNSPGQTAIAPYSVRARPKAPVATPMAWEQLDDTGPRRWTLRSMPPHLEPGEDPWETPAPALDFAEARARLDEELREATR